MAKNNEEKAKAQARIADSRRIAALSESERDKHLDRSLLLAVEALKVENTFEARGSLFKALRARPGQFSFLSTAPQRKGNEIMPPRIAVPLRGLRSLGIWP